ncbi:high-potential iron-sulfur protein [Rhodoferax sp.]|jgi:hypothetical protein|uniref:high-potential iron-sulfur protein n=1 Tax=Rhodoferax sp. TaxID=50421 RepID=UPI003783AB60
MSNRREFIVQVSLGGGALLAGSAFAQGTMLSETDKQAVTLGYKADTTKVDKTKFPKHTVDQKCSNCVLYQGKASDKAGGCGAFPGKQVAGNGWCSAWAKKA